jgi:addiction module HigA family antidote
MANEYLPKFLVTPGEVLKEHIESLNMSQAELSARTGLSKKTINEIIKGIAPITPETAVLLERTIGSPARFWNSLEIHYQEEKIRLRQEEKLSKYQTWLKRFPVREMIKKGWIEKKDSFPAQLEELLKFLGIAEPELYDKMQNEKALGLQFRQSTRLGISNESLSIWIRKGVLSSYEESCEPFNKAKFKNALLKIRELTSESPSFFIPKLKSLCCSSGVAIVFVPLITKTGVYGATQWFSKDKAIIQLSLRCKSNDHFWFTFFHEAGHILLHGHKEMFIETDTNKSQKEIEANVFASKLLIPENEYKSFVKNVDRMFVKNSDIESFAIKIGIAPGIVVGRMQHDDKLDKDRGNKLKIFYKDEDFINLTT